jgi:methionyl-tRNA formyltransferase
MTNHLSSLGILFLGTPLFAALHLEALLQSGYRVVGVCTQPDKKSGRGNRVHPNPVKETARNHGIPVLQPLSSKDHEAWSSIERFQADVGVVVAFGQILRKTVLDSLPMGFINVHASLLPRYRGASPMERAIQNGETETGITIMRMVRALDAGDIGWTQRAPIFPFENYGRLSARLARIGCRSLVDFLGAVISGSARWTPQDDSLATYAEKIDKHELRIQWDKPAKDIQRTIRAFDPHAPAWCQKNGVRLKLMEARDVDDGQAIGEPGRIQRIDRRGAWIQTGQGLLCVSDLQFPSKRPISFFAARNGRLIQEGDLLE